MSRKKKRLIEHFDLVIESGNFESFKNVFEKCEIDAKIPGGKTTRNAFSFKCLTPEHIQFLVDNGLEVNADCGNGLPAVAFCNAGVYRTHDPSSGADASCAAVFLPRPLPYRV